MCKTPALQTASDGNTASMTRSRISGITITIGIAIRITLIAFASCNTLISDPIITVCIIPAISMSGTSLV